MGLFHEQEASLERQKSDTPPELDALKTIFDRAASLVGQKISDIADDATRTEFEDDLVGFSSIRRIATGEMAPPSGDGWRRTVSPLGGASNTTSVIYSVVNAGDSLPQFHLSYVRGDDGVEDVRMSDVGSDRVIKLRRSPDTLAVTVSGRKVNPGTVSFRRSPGT